MPTITPNPFTDVFAKPQMHQLEIQMYNELKQYKGQEPTSAQLKNSEAALKAVLNSSLFAIGSYSLAKGCQEIGMTGAPVQLLHELRLECKARADFAANSIINTTGQAFGVMFAALTKKKAVGKQRNKSNAEYEGSRIFFEQRRKGWGLRHGVRKAWYCQSANVCDACQENEDQGAIPITEEWDSGDQAPPAHINCECLMSLIL